jgi:hypothetical protein
MLITAGILFVLALLFYFIDGWFEHAGQLIRFLLAHLGKRKIHTIKPSRMSYAAVILPTGCNNLRNPI